jgi:hypothetical protein
MFSKSLAVAALASIAIAGVNVSSASAAKLEKVDIVKEGIDLGKIVVNANGNGYTNYASGAHKFMVRVFAKGKGRHNVYWAAVSSHMGNSPFTAGVRTYFDQRAASRTEGWGVYQKSLNFHVSPENMQWLTTPKNVCENNLKAEMARGRSKADVLKREWKLTAQASLVFSAAADTKSNIKKRDHKINRVDFRSKGILYPVAVVCKKGI